MDSGDMHLPHPVLLHKLRHDIDHPGSQPKKLENNGIVAGRKPRPREVASRYKSSMTQSPCSSPGTPTSSTPSTTASSSPSTPSTPFSQRRFSSPSAGKVPAEAVIVQPKRATSAERRPSSSSRSTVHPSARPSSPSSLSSRPSTPVHEAVPESHSTSMRTSRGPDGLWPSMRSLFSSSPAEPKNEKSIMNSSVDQTKLRANAVFERKRSPSRGMNSSDHLENSRSSENPHAKIIDHHRWPAMMGGRLSGGAMTRSVDLSDKSSKSFQSVVLSKGFSLKSIVPSESMNAMSRSVDLTDKVRRSLSSAASSRGSSPVKPRAPSSTDANLVSSSRASSPRKAAFSNGTDAGVKSTELADKLIASFSSTPIQGLASISQEKLPIMTTSSDSDVAERENGHLNSRTKSITSSAQSRAVSPQKNPAPIGSDATTEGTDLSIKINRSSTSSLTRGTSPKKTAVPAGSNSLSTSVDMVEKSSWTISSTVSSRGLSPRRTQMPDRPTKDPLSRGGSPRRTHAPDIAIKSHISRGTSPRRVHTSEGAKNEPVLREVSPRRMHVAEGISKEPISIGFSPRKLHASDDAYKEVPSQGISPRRMDVYSSKGANAEAEQKLRTDLNCTAQSIGRVKPLKQLKRTLSSPFQVLPRSSSPSKALSMPASSPRRLQSPSRVRPSSPASSSRSSTSSLESASPVFNYMVDTMKGKKSAYQGEETHQLRLLHNRNLQWCFANTYTDEILAIQKMDSEALLHSMWNTTMQLRESIVAKRMHMQLLRQETKLRLILKDQLDYLDQWEGLEIEHRHSLLGASEALRATTLCLPVTAGAKADLLTVRNAVGSAVDVMQAMSSSVPYLLSKIQGTKHMAAELSSVLVEERAMLAECRELLALSASLQVQECSLRAQLIREP